MLITNIKHSLGNIDLSSVKPTDLNIFTELKIPDLMLQPT